MYVFLAHFFNKCFPYAVKYAARRRETRYAEYAARRRQARFMRPRLEDLEERKLLDAYGFQKLDGTPNSGSYTSEPAIPLAAPSRKAISTSIPP
jgi:hypothetical protein